MAYQVKTIRYENASRKILLQNINGPCPLLAAANALLLRGVISLSGECIRSAVASTDDVVNMLAGWAIERSHRRGAHADESSDHEYHLNEVLSLLPSLQHGMDVNPKFNSPTAVEYTNNLAVFDSLGVELVHGWLLDPTEETAAFIGSKSYNELIEFVIRGNEAKEEVEKMNAQLVELEKKLKVSVGDKDEIQNQLDALGRHGEDSNVSATQCSSDDRYHSEASNEQSANISDDSAISTSANVSSEFISKTDDKTDEANAPNTIDSSPSDAIEQHHVTLMEAEDNKTNDETMEKSKNDLEVQISELRQKISLHTNLISVSNAINSFLTASSHQLTYHGLEQLHKHLSEDDLCVFFRNNHFATLTKHSNTLYLLVTDLGYANTPEIVWEKLDTIDGDTEYTDEEFCRPKVHEGLNTGPSINPELLLAQRSQTESDYALALALSEGRATSERMNDDESKLIAAATEASLKSYHGLDPTHDAESATNNNTEQKTQIDADREIALAFQRNQEQNDRKSEELARRLQEQEYAQSQQRPPPTARSTSRPVNSHSSRGNSTSASGNCIVS